MMLKTINYKKKNTAYLLWVFGGLFGAHNFYFRRLKDGLIKFALSVLILVGLITKISFFFNISWPLGFILLLLWFVDLPSLGKRVDRWNYLLGAAKAGIRVRGPVPDSYEDDEDEEGEVEDVPNYPRAGKKDKYPLQGQREVMLKNKAGRTVGTIRETNGRLEVRKFGGPLLGYYDPKQNITRTANGQIYARYNALTDLLDK